MQVSRQRNKSICNWHDLSEYRNELFGVAIISVIILHFCQDVVNNHCPSAIIVSLCNTYIHLIGSCGVDIFLFLSGMGLFFSLSKNRSIGLFYSNRFKRVGLTYLIWGGVFLFLYDIIIFHKHTTEFLYDLCLISFWRDGNVVFWYIALIVPCYIIYPIVYKIDRINNKIKRIIIKYSIILLSMITVTIIAIENPDWYDLTEAALCRVLPFLLGCFLGRLIYYNTRVSNQVFTFILMGLFLRVFLLLMKLITPVFDNILSIEYPINRWIIGWAGIGFVFICIIVLPHISDSIKKFLRITGRYSLELYLTHISLRRLLRETGHYKYQPLIMFSIIAASIVFSYLLQRTVNQINNSDTNCK